MFTSNKALRSLFFLFFFQKIISVPLRLFRTLEYLENQLLMGFNKQASYGSLLVLLIKQTMLLKAVLSEEKLSLLPCLRSIFKCFVLNAWCFKAKQLRIVLRHGIRPDFLEIHLLLVLLNNIVPMLFCTSR